MSERINEKTIRKSKKVDNPMMRKVNNKNRNLFATNKEGVSKIFRKYKNGRGYLGVYKKSDSTVFLTFGKMNEFPEELTFGRNTFSFVSCINEDLDFDTQFAEKFI